METSLSLSPPPPPLPWTFWLTGEICKNIHSLLYTQMLILIITLGHSMWPLILLFTNEFLEVRVCTASNYKDSKLWGVALPWDSRSTNIICFHSWRGDWTRNSIHQRENLSPTGAHVYCNLDPGPYQLLFTSRNTFSVKKTFLIETSYISISETGKIIFSHLLEPILWS